MQQFWFSAGFSSFWVKKRQIFYIFFKEPSLARSVPNPLKVPSLVRSVPKLLKVPSLARSVPKPYVAEVGGLQMCHCESEWSESEVKWKVKVKKSDPFLVLHFSEFNICYREYFNLNLYIGKKVQKNFLMGLKIWLSWGSGFFFQNHCR